MKKEEILAELKEIDEQYRRLLINLGSFIDKASYETAYQAWNVAKNPSLEPEVKEEYVEEIKDLFKKYGVSLEHGDLVINCSLIWTKKPWVEKVLACFAMLCSARTISRSISYVLIPHYVRFLWFRDGFQDDTNLKTFFNEVTAANPKIASELYKQFAAVSEEFEKDPVILERMEKLCPKGLLHNQGQCRGLSFRPV